MPSPVRPRPSSFPYPPTPSFSCPVGLTALALAIAAAVIIAPTPASAQQQAPTPCVDIPESRELDFWIGTWDVFNPAGDTAGVNVIEPILDHCVLLESWTGARGGGGSSMNFWDAQRRTWRQVWVSDRGNVLDYRQGELRDGAMHFQGLTIDAEDDTTLQKLTFVDVAPDTVRQVFEASRDAGVTWDTTWVGIYVRRPGG